jgi:DNA-binding NtrC family response regulator
MSETTGTMEGMRGGAERQGPADAGLVLLYAPNFADLPPVFPIPGDPVVIGRVPPPGGHTIQQTAVSRTHARIARVDDRFVVVDLRSRNGTLLNGRMIEESTLEDGDELRVGDAIFKFVADGASAYAPYRIDGTVKPPARRPIAGMIGGYQLAKLSQDIETIARAGLSVLVHGETGTGKELAARALHQASGRKGPFCALNCAAIPATLVESELFGWRRGAFTGADRDRAGLVRASHGGTLLLDEIGDMPIEAQAKLLRMLETREVVPLGAEAGERVDVHVVCATHRDLQSLVDEGKFRGDLFARINGYTLRLPPLRQRKEDLYVLVRHFLAKGGRGDLKVSFPFMTSLCHHAWPYNVRELEAAIRRAIAVSDGRELEVKHLPEIIQDRMKSYGSPVERSAPAPAPKRIAGPPTEGELRGMLERHQGNVAAVARELGKDRVQIHRWMRLHGIDPESYRGA